MPPQHDIFKAAIQECYYRKDRYDQAVDEKDREAARDLLELHVLELPDRRLEDHRITPLEVKGLLEGLAKRLGNTPDALRLLNRQIAEEDISKVPLLLKPYRGALSVNSVIVSGEKFPVHIARTMDALNVSYDARSKRYQIRQHIIPMLVTGDLQAVGLTDWAQWGDSTTPNRQIIQALERAQGGPSMSFDPMDIVDVGLEGQNAGIRVIRRIRMTGGQGPDEFYRHEKTLRIEFPSAGEAKRFLKQLQEHCLGQILPLWNPLPVFPHPKPDIEDAMRAQYEISSISIGPETLNASEAGESIYVGVHCEAGERYRIVVRGNSGLSRLNWACFSFPTTSIVYRRGRSAGCIYLGLADERIVHIVMKSARDIDCFWRILEGKLIGPNLR